MFAQVVQEKITPAEAVSGLDAQAKRIYRKWQDQGLV